MSKALSDLYHIVIGNEKEVEKLVQSVTGKYKINNFDKKILYAEDTTIESFLQELEFLPVFSSRKLVVMKHAESLKKSDWEKIFTYLDQPYSHNILILTGKSSKTSLRKYTSRIYKEAKTPEGELFSTIYKLRHSSREQLISLFHNYLGKKEKGFPVVLSAIEIYLRNEIIREKKIKKNTSKKFLMLHQLDFKLKTGQLPADSGLELFLFYLLT